MYVHTPMVDAAAALPSHESSSHVNAPLQSRQYRQEHASSPSLLPSSVSSYSSASSSPPRSPASQSPPDQINVIELSSSHPAVVEQSLRSSPLRLDANACSSIDRRSSLHTSRLVALKANVKSLLMDDASFDTTISWCLVIVAFIIRFYRLAVPASVVFDEFHFGKFVDNLLKRELLFDIHPPLGKLTLAALGYLAGYRPVEGFAYDRIGKEYGSVLFYPLREIAAMFGTATVPLVYATARTLGVSWLGSLLTAGLYCFDNLNVIESRLILMDSQIMFYLVLSLFCAFKLFQSRPYTLRRYFWLTATAIVCGLSMSIKWTALATPALIAIVSFFGLHFLPDPLSILECAWAASCGVAVYMFFFYIHFKVVIKNGPGAPFFPESFRRTLIGHPSYDPAATKPSFLWLFWYTNKTMLATNASIKTRHRWESYWYWWVVNWRGLLYFNRQETDTKRWASVYLLCNPVVCWFCAFCVAVMLAIVLYMTRYRDFVFGKSQVGRHRRNVTSSCLFLVCGWLFNLLPYILVDRSAFVYHYLPGLLYAQLLSGFMIDQLPRPLGVISVVVSLSACIASFFYFAPWTYCFALTSEEHASMRWMGRWD